MPDPTSPEDFEARHAVAYIVTGNGTNRTRHVPCPFCAAADWMVYNDPEARRTMTREHECQVCGRRARFEIVRLEDGTRTAELVQTGGPDPPAWMVPPRRVEP
jgi:hypothetical protein